jgi:hypothetical protein
VAVGKRVRREIGRSVAQEEGEELREMRVIDEMERRSEKEEWGKARRRSCGSLGGTRS